MLEVDDSAEHTFHPKGLSDLLKALVDPKDIRLSIVILLLEKDMIVGDLIKHTGITGYRMTFHLGVLRSFKVIESWKKGNCVWNRVLKKKTVKACIKACEEFAL